MVSKVIHVGKGKTRKQTGGRKGKTASDHEESEIDEKSGSELKRRMMISLRRMAKSLR